MIHISENMIVKNISSKNMPVVLKAIYKTTTGWSGYISNEFVKIPQNKCHVSPNFADCDYTTQNCWTKKSVIDYLETKAKNPRCENQFVEMGISKNLVSYRIIAKFKNDQIGWRGYIVTNKDEKYIEINKFKCHVSPSFEDCKKTDNKCWTKNSVIKYLHEIASEL